MSPHAPHDRCDGPERIPEQSKGSGLDLAAPTSITVGTVLVCDDRVEVRDAILTILAELPRFRVVGDAADAASCLESVEQARPNVVILDVSIPGGGPGLVTALKNSHPNLHIIVFSGRHDSRTRRDMMAAGADQYVVKTGRVRLLVDALDHAVSIRQSSTV